ncbi:MAG: HAD family acid phosphatase [Melioribacteraceae bacterium]|nr:HAD family acid phosphatase [Melioribacteraceae bacterium]MCF8353829.1 HAD family acid phosphatase [Melioribacteraceae bacterium]MCF8393665.1 HAD family acid phosphatase [Melioribacteraceae bacterium]MCF8419475.1 HAD family acid phosphatase [Melioribacteraceae bacterium]
MKVLFTAFLILSLSNCAPELVNLSVSKQIVKEYYKSGKYSEELNEIVNDVKSQFNWFPFEENSTVVFDVDDTVISGYGYAEHMDFGYEPESWYQWIRDEKCEEIPEMKKLYNFFISKGTKIVFLTGRDQKVYQPTYENLIKDGFTEFDTLICRPENDNHRSSAEYKQEEREILTGKGYKIIATIGDQEGDLEGKNTGIKIKLPNYLYKLD